MSNPSLRASIIAALCIVLGILGGCSALRLGYGQADALAFRWLDSYADFDGAQTLRVREALASWFTWHRRTQLADYADVLTRLDAEVLADTTPERICGWWAEVRGRIDRGMDQAAPAVTELALTLKPAQLENIERHYAKSNAEFRADFMQADPSRRAHETVKRMAGRAEWLYGDIDRTQRARLARWVADSPFDPNLAFDERRRRQQDGLQVLRALAGGTFQSAAAQAEIRAWLRRIEHSPREPDRLQAERIVQHNCRLAADLHNSTSATQRQLASRKVRSWAADLRALAADPG